MLEKYFKWRNFVLLLAAFSRYAAIGISMMAWQPATLNRIMKTGHLPLAGRHLNKYENFDVFFKGNRSLRILNLACYFNYSNFTLNIPLNLN